MTEDHDLSHGFFQTGLNFFRLVTLLEILNGGCTPAELAQRLQTHSACILLIAPEKAADVLAALHAEGCLTCRPLGGGSAFYDFSQIGRELAADVRLVLFGLMTAYQDDSARTTS